MKKGLQITMICAVFLALFQPARAQYILKEADAQYRLFNYAKAADIYEQAYGKKATLYAAEKLGECYAQMRDYKQAESWYAIASGMAGSVPQNSLEYAKALQQNSKYAEAKAQYQKYIALDKSVNPVQQNLWLASCDSAIKWMKNPSNINLDNQKRLNGGQSDWGAVEYNGGAVFASDRTWKVATTQKESKPFLKFDGARVPDKNIYGWTGNRYLHLYFQNGTDSAKRFPLDAGTEYHVGPASFTADGKEMYFSLTKISQKPVYVNGKLATVNIEIYMSKKDDSGNWSTPIAFKYNKADSYSVGDPFISKDGKTLYFVSDMPGGKGGTDIYKSVKASNGEWSAPENLEGINTAGNDRSPSLGTGDKFYFSTDGRVGMGGLDIFSTELNGSSSVPKNLGYPVNSPQDDFAYSSLSGQAGYLSSNRTGGAGSDDIYSFAQQILAFKLSGIAFDRKTGLPLNGALITLNRIGGGNVSVQTDVDGKFGFNLDGASDYGLTGEKTGYRNDVTTLTTKNLSSSKTVEKNLYLDLIEIDKAIRIENIYYDFDKSNIRADAKVELDKLVKIMQDNPTIWIELGSHTDSRGNDQYNQWLSQSRANSAVQYIIDRGISKNRITAKGYGESMLLNKCANGVKCTEAEHQLNRRTEFKIVKQ